MRRIHIFTYIIYFIAIFLILEFTFRTITPSYQRSIFSYDPRLIWKYVPNSNLKQGKFIFHHNISNPKISINKLGFRDTNYIIESKKKRIIFLGDSYTVGIAIPESDIFPRYLETKLNKNKIKNYEIINFAITAYCTDQEYIVLKDIALKYKPKIVVLTVAPNDIRETYVKKLFYLENGELKLNKINKAFNLNLKNRFVWYLSTKSEIFARLKNIIGLNHGNFDYVLNNVTCGVFFHENKGYNVDEVLFLKNETDEMKEAVKLFTALIEEMNKICLNNDCKLIIVNLPIKIQFDGSLNNEVFDQLKIKKILKNITSKNNIPLLDLHSTINNSKNPLDYYLGWDFHLSKEGHKLVGDELYRFLVNENLLIK